MTVAAGPVAEAVAAAVRTAGGRGLTLAELEAVAVAADATWATAPDRRARLRRCVDELADAGVLTLPKGAKGWDRSGHPPLPAKVRAAAGTTARRGPSRRAPAPATLRHELAGAHRLGELAPGDLEVLDQVNRWLAAGGGTLVVPHRERSLEVFGDEKKLDTLARGRMFAEGVLTYALLRCEWVPPQLPWRRVGDGRCALVLENAATYHSVLRALEGDPGRYGVVASGGGNAFSATAAGLAAPDVGPVDEIRYFGDLDATGLEIPRRASATAEAVGLPEVQPAEGLYRLLLDLGAAQACAPVGDGRARDAAAWLGDLADDAYRLLVRPARLAQEAVGAEALAAHPGALER